jgi:hypothetical protein
MTSATFRRLLNAGGTFLWSAVTVGLLGLRTEYGGGLALVSSPSFLSPLRRFEIEYI